MYLNDSSFPWNVDFGLLLVLELGFPWKQDSPVKHDALETGAAHYCSKPCVKSLLAFLVQVLSRALPHGQHQPLLSGQGAHTGFLFVYSPCCREAHMDLTPSVLPHRFPKGVKSKTPQQRRLLCSGT